MRPLLALAVVVALAGCKTKPRAEEPNRDPYRNVTPQKIKQQVEDTQKKEDERNDRVLEQAK
jgi:hypothetical protein